jgi:hypothetical protein
MTPLFWTTSLEAAAKVIVGDPGPIYPRLWEYIDTDLKYLIYDKTVKAAMLQYGKMKEVDFAFALDTSQLPWLCVSSSGDSDDPLVIQSGYKVVSETITLDAAVVNALEAGQPEITFTQSGKPVEWIGVLRLVALVELGNIRARNIKLAYGPEITAVLMAVYGRRFPDLDALRTTSKKPLPMIQK